MHKTASTEALPCFRGAQGVSGSPELTNLLTSGNKDSDYRIRNVTEIDTLIFNK